MDKTRNVVKNGLFGYHLVFYQIQIRNHLWLTKVATMTQWILKLVLGTANQIRLQFVMK